MGRGCASGRDGRTWAIMPARAASRKNNMKRTGLFLAMALGPLVAFIHPAWAAEVSDRSPLREKATYLERDLIDKHSLDGLYISIVPSGPIGVKQPHTVNQPGNVIHAGVWTGRYLAGVGYQY